MYLHSQTGEILLAENIQHWLAQHDFVRELLCTALNDRSVLSIFTPMVSDILQREVPSAMREQIESMMLLSPGAWVH